MYKLQIYRSFNELKQPITTLTFTSLFIQTIKFCKYFQNLFPCPEGLPQKKTSSSARIGKNRSRNLGKCPIFRRKKLLRKMFEKCPKILRKSSHIQSRRKTCVQCPLLSLKATNDFQNPRRYQVCTYLNQLFKAAVLKLGVAKCFLRVAKVCQNCPITSDLL